MTAEMIVFPAFLVLLVIMYYKNKSDVKKHRARMKKNANLSMRTNPKPTTKRTAKKDHLGKQIDVVKNWPQSKPRPR